MNQGGFEDILSERRMEWSNWYGVFRSLNPKLANEIKPRPTPELHKEAVLKSSRIKNLIEEISQKQNVSKEKLEKEIKDILEETGYKKNVDIIRWLALVLTKICLKVCSGIFVNVDGISKLKDAMGRCPVIFVPSHRSYADFIIFSYVCFNYDIQIPAIAAAMDFHGMMGMGEILRNTGAFYIKRSYDNSEIYWPTFREYVSQLVSKGDEPIEFFIEGTRSRSNKSLAPKYGLITMILKMFFLHQVDDILFVPVSINYDRILEESLFAFELLGIPKPKESTSGFFKSLKIVKEKFGNIYINFDKPISARTFFANKLDTSSHSFGSVQFQEITEKEKSLIPPLAHEIIRRQQVSTVISYFNLISLMLNNNLPKGEKLIKRQDLKAEIEIIKSVLQSWGANIFEQNMDDVIEENLLIHSNLIYEVDGKIGLVNNKIIMGPLDPTKLKAHALSENTITYSVPFVMLQLYTNPVLHYLVDAALIVIILKSPGKMTKDQLFAHFCTLRSIFSLEFVLMESWYEMRFEEAVTRLIQQNIITFKGKEFDIFENNYFQEVLISSIQPFILTYFVVTEILQKMSNMVNEKTILSNIQKLFEDAIIENQIFIHPYCMSLDTLTNCLNSFTNMRLLRRTKTNGQNMYEINRGKIARLKEDLEIYIPSFHIIKSFEIFLHIKSKI